MKTGGWFTLPLAALASSAALAQPDPRLNEDGVLEMSVASSDIDLTTAAGRKTLDRRIRRAADSVCPDEAGNRDLTQWMERRACVATAIVTAERQVLQRQDQARNTAGGGQQLSRR